MTSDEKDRCLLDITRFIEEGSVVSYYELQTYAYDNKPEWVALFKDKTSRFLIRSKLRKEKQSLNASYPCSKEAAVLALREAKRRYFIRIEAEERSKWDNM